MPTATDILKVKTIILSNAVAVIPRQDCRKARQAMIPGVRLDRQML